MSRRAAIGCAVAVLLGIGVIGWRDIDRQRGASSVDRAAAAHDSGAETRGVAAEPDRPAATDRVELDPRAMSQTFRHSTFLAAIRKADFYCDDVIDAHETASRVWIASCRDLRGYKIEVDGAGEYRVEPIPHQVDAVF